MGRLFILIKKKKSKKLLGAIPARKGISRKGLLSSARKQIKSNFSFRIVDEATLKKVLKSMAKKGIAIKKSKSASKKRRVVRRRSSRGRK